MAKHAVSVATRAAAVRAAETAGIVVGDLVWFANRAHGRTTEHLATVTAVDGDTLSLSIKDQGETSVFDHVRQWSSDSISGWWRAKS